MTQDDHGSAKFLRLKNGDDIVCECYEYEDSEGNTYYTVINPLKTVYVSRGGGDYLQIAFLPWVYPRICDLQEFNIDKKEVILYQDVSEKMNEYYWDSVQHYMTSKRETIEEEPIEEYSEEILEEIKELMRSGKVFH